MKNSIIIALAVVFLFSGSAMAFSSNMIDPNPDGDSFVFERNDPYVTIELLDYNPLMSYYYQLAVYKNIYDADMEIKIVDGREQVMGFMTEMTEVIASDEITIEIPTDYLVFQSLGYNFWLALYEYDGEILENVSVEFYPLMWLDYNHTFTDGIAYASIQNGNPEYLSLDGYTAYTEGFQFDISAVKLNGNYLVIDEPIVIHIFVTDNTSDRNLLAYGTRNVNWESSDSLDNFSIMSNYTREGISECYGLSCPFDPEYCDFWDFDDNCIINYLDSSFAVINGITRANVTFSYFDADYGNAFQHYSTKKVFNERTGYYVYIGFDYDDYDYENSYFSINDDTFIPANFSLSDLDYGINLHEDLSQTHKYYGVMTYFETFVDDGLTGGMSGSDRETDFVTAIRSWCASDPPNGLGMPWMFTVFAFLIPIAFIGSLYGFMRKYEISLPSYLYAIPLIAGIYCSYIIGFMEYWVMIFMIALTTFTVVYHFREPLSKAVPIIEAVKGVPYRWRKSEIGERIPTPRRKRVKDIAVERYVRPTPELESYPEYMRSSARLYKQQLQQEKEALALGYPLEQSSTVTIRAKDNGELARAEKTTPSIKARANGTEKLRKRKKARRKK